MTHRIAALDKDLCQPKKCGLECIKYCPVNKSGADCIILNEETKKAQKQAAPNSKKSVQGPNINPSSTYNFKK